MAPLLKIRSLKAQVAKKLVLNGVTLSIGQGEIHALMGRNGSGKSSLAMTLLGHGQYIPQGFDRSTVEFEGKNLLEMTVDERARAGLFVAWQNPLTLPGVTVFTLCKTAYEARGAKIESVVKFKEQIEELLIKVGLPKEYVTRAVNEGFSGGEKKRLELLQIMLFQPKLIILDEIDSGLDIDALKMVGKVVVDLGKRGLSFLIITHYKKLVDHVKPDFVHVMEKGKITRTGGVELVAQIEDEGYGDKSDK